MQGVIAGEHDKAFAIVIEPSGRLYAAHVDEIGERRVRGAWLGRELAQHAVRLPGQKCA